jgi:hypothetical protein
LTYAGDLESLAPVAFVRADIVDAAKMRGMIESFEPDACVAAEQLVGQVKACGIFATVDTF